MKKLSFILITIISSIIFSLTSENIQAQPTLSVSNQYIVSADSARLMSLADTKDQTRYKKIHALIFGRNHFINLKNQK